MQIRSMITNGGAHPPEKHADTTAWKIIDLIRVPETPVDPAMAAADRAAVEANREAMRQLKAQLEPKIAAVLVKHHAAVQAGERGKLDDHGDERLTHELDVAEHVEVAAVLAEINPLFAGTAVATHFADAPAQERMREILSDDFAHAMEIERSRHADVSQHPVAQVYRQARHQHGARHAHAHAQVAAAS